MGILRLKQQLNVSFEQVGIMSHFGVLHPVRDEMFIETEKAVRSQLLWERNESYDLILICGLKAAEIGLDRRYHKYPVPN